MAYPSPKPEPSPSYPDAGSDTGIRRKDVLFLAQATLDSQVRDRAAMLDGAILTVKATQERFVIRDAMRVLGQVGRSVDVFGMTGRVLTVTELFALGAVLSPSSIRIGPVEYEIQLGFVMQFLPEK